MEKVLILDANHRSALAATRSLGGRGLTVIAADETKHTLAGSSKYCRESFAYPSPYEFPQRFIASLKKEVAERRIGVIFPMTEITTSLVLRERESLKDVNIPFASFDKFDALTDKWNLLQLAHQLNVPTPKTHFIRECSELDRILSQVTFPVVLKPRRSRIWSEGRWIAASVKYAHSARQAKQIVATQECFSRHPFLVQEYVQGEAQGVFALYDRAQPLTFFAHRRLREKPPSGGVSVLSESTEVNPRMREMACRILDSVQWHGVAMVEFKVSSDGVPYLMEVNARFWGSLQLAIDAGVDFPWLLYQLATGKAPVYAGDPKIGIRSRWLLGDFAHLYRVLTENGAGPNGTGPRARDSILHFFNFFESCTRYEVNRWYDLRPFLFELKRLLWPKAWTLTKR